MNLHPESWDALLYVTADGEVDFDTTVRLCEQAGDLAIERRVSKILIDQRFLWGELPAIERIEVAVRGTDYMAELGIHPTVAVVGHPPTCNGLAVIAAQTLGADVRLFSTIPEALKWLNESRVLHR